MWYNKISLITNVYIGLATDVSLCVSYGNVGELRLSLINMDLNRLSVVSTDYG